MSNSCIGYFDMSLKIIMEKLLDWPESKFKTNGVNINYRIFGNGSPIILLHGYPQNSLIWIIISFYIIKEASTSDP